MDSQVDLNGLRLALQTSFANISQATFSEFDARLKQVARCALTTPQRNAPNGIETPADREDAELARLITNNSDAAKVALPILIENYRKIGGTLRLDGPFAIKTRCQNGLRVTQLKIMQAQLNQESEAHLTQLHQQERTWRQLKAQACSLAGCARVVEFLRSCTDSMLVISE